MTSDPGHGLAAPCGGCAKEFKAVQMLQAATPLPSARPKVMLPAPPLSRNDSSKQNNVASQMPMPSLRLPQAALSTSPSCHWQRDRMHDQLSLQNTALLEAAGDGRRGTRRGGSRPRRSLPSRAGTPRPNGTQRLMVTGVSAPKAETPRGSGGKTVKVEEPQGSTSAENPPCCEDAAISGIAPLRLESSADHAAESAVCTGKALQAGRHANSPRVSACRKANDESSNKSLPRLLAADSIRPAASKAEPFEGSAAEADVAVRPMQQSMDGNLVTSSSGMPAAGCTANTSPTEPCSCQMFCMRWFPARPATLHQKEVKMSSPVHMNEEIEQSLSLHHWQHEVERWRREAEHWKFEADDRAKKAEQWMEAASEAVQSRQEAAAGAEHWKWQAERWHHEVKRLLQIAEGLQAAAKEREMIAAQSAHGGGLADVVAATDAGQEPASRELDKKADECKAVSQNLSNEQVDEALEPQTLAAAENLDNAAPIEQHITSAQEHEDEASTSLQLAVDGQSPKESGNVEILGVASPSTHQHSIARDESESLPEEEVMLDSMAERMNGKLGLTAVPMLQSPRSPGSQSGSLYAESPRSGEMSTAAVSDPAAVSPHVEQQYSHIEKTMA